MARVSMSHVSRLETGKHVGPKTIRKVTDAIEARERDLSRHGRLAGSLTEPSTYAPAAFVRLDSRVLNEIADAASRILRLLATAQHAGEPLAPSDLPATPPSSAPSSKDARRSGKSAE
jgi:hypothetical protein